MSTDRLRCVVPGCRRTIAGEDVEDTECICSKHWKTIPLERRRIWRRRKNARIAQRDKNVAFAKMHGGLEFADVSAELILRRVESRLWRRLVREAIEQAVGIG